MYPEPEVCLNLPAWQEFLGFDLQGQNGWFDIEPDFENGTVSIRKAGDAPFGFGKQLERLKMIMDPGEVRETGSASSDTLPGPWKTWEKTGDGTWQVRIGDMGD